MEKYEYLEKIRELEVEFEQNKLGNEELLKKIDYLYCYKPVSMRLQVLKSKVLLRYNTPDAVIQQFGDSYSRESDNVDNIALWEQVILAYKQSDIHDVAQCQSYMKSRLLKDGMSVNNDDELNQIRRCFIAGNESLDNLMKLERTYWDTCNYLMAFCVALYATSLYSVDNFNWDRYVKCGNIAYFKERIDSKCTVTIVACEDEKEDYDILAYLLSKLDVPVYMISDIVDIDENFEIKDSVKVSFDNQQEYEDCIVIPAIAKYNGQEYKGNNIPYIIDYICKNITENDFSIVVASNNMLESLRTHQDISKRFERLSDYHTSYLEDKIGFAWCGDYYEYLRLLYKQDIKACVDRKPEVKFSIVVPVRNATETLYHTLKTCIEQEYEGDYEVVLSDNSIGGHNVAYETYKKLNSNIIKYYKTPRDLNLTKSYEYAFLQTRGKYIIPIGADDAVLPWALKCLDEVWDKMNSHRNVLRWDRGFYAWPGFNGGQENQLVIPGCYKKNEIVGSINVSEAYEKMIKTNPSAMYELPNMYLNSGFKRDYMKKIYDETGRLWDGHAQDIYTGIQNLAIEKEFLHIPYPIVIAGMSPSSTGSLCTSVTIDNRDKDKVDLLCGGVSIYKIIMTSREHMIPGIGSDVSGIYICIERLIDKGILNENFYKDENEIKQIYINCYNSLSVLSDKFEKNLYEGYEIAKKRGEDFKVWFERTILTHCEKPRYYDPKEVERRKKYKHYIEGFTENGGVVLDASRYGVTNIYEAVQLFKDFLHF